MFLVCFCVSVCVVMSLSGDLEVSKREKMEGRIHQVRRVFINLSIICRDSLFTAC